MGIDRNAVFLLTSAEGDKKTFGTGFAVAYQDGQLYLLTCAHVLDQLDNRIRVSGHEAAAQVVAKGAADGIDLALLRIPCEQPPPLLNSPVSGEPEMKFHICGYGPFAGAKDNYVLRNIEGKLGKSIVFESVRGKGRIDAWDLHVEDDDFSRLQGGYSGSPLCDAEGGLIAVVSHKIGSQGERGHALSVANVQGIYPDIDRLIPSFSDIDNSVRIGKKKRLYRHLPDSGAKSLSFALLAVVLLAGVILSIKYLLPDSREENPLEETREESFLKNAVNSDNYGKELLSATDSDENMAAPLIETAFIPGGCFQMGSPESEQGRSSYEGPVHKVCVNDFEMGRYEVTQGQWVKIMGSNPAEFQKDENHPVEKVSWNKVQEFIQKLNKKTEKKYRLPTEAEWEYAARAKTTAARYWGDDISCEQAMYGNNKDGDDSCAGYIGSEKGLIPYSTAPVGSYPPNKFGLYDMLGNVSEFCSDRLNGKGENRVFRGGSLNDSEREVRSAFRYGLPPHERDGGIGFRLVLPVRQN